MGRTAYEIRMDYNDAVRQADNLNQVARELQKLANRDLQDCVSDISHNWTGSNAAAYAGKCNTLKSNILKTSDNLSRTADTIRKIAKNTYDAEMRALNLARLRKY